MALPNIIPATPKALLSLGIEEWNRRGVWPISESEFAEISALVHDQFDAMYTNLPTDWREALLNDIRIFSWLSQYLHAIAVSARSAHANASMAGMADAVSLYQPDWTSLADVTPRRINRFALTRYPYELRRAWLGNSQFSPLPRFLRLLRPRNTWSFGSRNSLKLGFCSENDHLFWTPIVTDYLSTVQKPDCLDSAVEDIFRTAVEAICSAFESRFHVRPDRENIHRTWLARVSTFHAHIQAVLKWKNRPKLLLVTSMGNATNRTMAAAARLSGDRVLVFHHGNNPGYTKAVAFSYVEFALASEYISATSGISRALRDVNNAMPPARTRDIRFVSLNSTIHETLRGQLQRPKVQSVRRILVAGYPFHSPPVRLGYGHGDFFALRMPLELETIRFLRANGYEVAYKPHPETEPEVAKAMQSEGSFCCSPSFEKALGQVDLVLFTYPLTTALGLALCTDLPLVMIDLEGRDWMPAVYDTLRQRCVMVPAQFNERNLISFRGSDLLEGIAEAPSRVSDVYFDAYLRPNDTV